MESVRNSSRDFQFQEKERSDSPQTFPSRNNDYPPTVKHIGGNGDEDPPQSDNSRRRRHQHQQLAPPVMVPPSSGFHQKDQSPIPEDPSPQQSLPIDSSFKKMDQNSVEHHMDIPPKNPNPTSYSHPPVNKHGGNHVSHTNNKVTEPKADQNPPCQPPPPPPKVALEKPDGYPEPGPPTAASVMEPRSKKGIKRWLEKISDCFS